MKKLLVSAISLAVVASAYAGIEGTYTTVKYIGADTGNGSLFSGGDTWSSDEEDPELWDVVVSLKEGNVYTIENLVEWNETVEGTYDEATATLTIAAGTVIDETYNYMICGGIDGYSTMNGVINYCDANNGWLTASRGLRDIVFKYEDGNFSLTTQLLIYSDYYHYDGFHGAASTVYGQLVLAPVVEEADIVGTYVTELYEGCDVGNDYKFSSGEAWSNQGEDSEDEEDSNWEATITAAEEGYTIENLIGWDEIVAGTFNAETNVLTIAAGTVIYVDESGYEYKICGGLEGYDTAKGVMDYCDANSGYIYASRGLKDIELSYEEGKLTATTPILIYIDYYPGSSYHGAAMSIFSQLVLALEDDPSGVQSVEAENSDAPAEYYNLRGIRVNNPTSGLYIVRKGNKTTKTIIR